MTNSDSKPDSAAGKLLVGVLLAIVLGATFWYTLAVHLNPDGSLSSVGTTQSDEVSNDKDMSAIDQMEPAYLMRQGKVEEAVLEANNLVKGNPLSVKNLICAGNVLSAAPGHQDDGFALLQKAKYLAPKVAGSGSISRAD